MRTARRTTRAGIALAMGAFVATTLSVGTATAQPAVATSDQPTKTAAMAMPTADLDAQQEVCDNVGNINNGRRWEAYSKTGNGWAEFYEYGEKLRVADRKSNGTRAEAEFASCQTGEVIGRYDSGPDEGAWDQEWYDFDYAEGRVVIFRVCDKRAKSCSGWVRANA